MVKKIKDWFAQYQGRRQERQEQHRKKQLNAQYLQAEKLITFAEQSDDLGSVAGYLTSFLEIARQSSTPEVYAPEDAHQILLDKTYQTLENEGFSSIDNIGDFLERNQKSFASYPLFREEIAQKILAKKRAHYLKSLVDIVGKIEQSVHKGKNDLSLIERYENVRDQLAPFLQDEQFPEISLPNTDGQHGFAVTEIKLDLDKAAYDLAIRMSISNLDTWLKKLPAEEILTDKFQGHYDRVIDSLRMYAQKARLNAEMKEGLEQSIENLNETLYGIAEPVVSQVEQFHDELYAQLEHLAEEPESVTDFAKTLDKKYLARAFDYVFERLKNFSLQYKMVLEDSAEDLSQSGQGLVEQMKNNADQYIKSKEVVSGNSTLDQPMKIVYTG